MRTSIHAIVCVILAAALYPFYKLSVLWIFAGGVLIDIDHYLWYISRFKKYNLKECYHYCAVETFKDNWKEVTGALFIFHNFEFLVLVSALSFYSTPAFLFTVGLLSHYLLDFIWHAYGIKKPTHALSFLWWLVKRKTPKH